MSRLTFEPGRDWFPVWSPNGQHWCIAAREMAYTEYGIYRKDAGGAGPEEMLVGEIRTGALIPSSVSPDGRYLLYTSGNDIFALPLTGAAQDRKPVPYLQTPFEESRPQFSPDGRWVTYVSNESGRDEIYTQVFPLSGRKWQSRITKGPGPGGDATARSCSS